MRKMMWLLGASAMLLPVVSQGAISFRLAPGPTPVVPGLASQQGYIDLIAEPGNANDAAEPIAGYDVIVSYTDQSGHLTLLTPFAKRTGADVGNNDLADAPDVEVPLARQIQASAGKPIILNQNPDVAKSVHAQQINLATEEVLGTGGGVIRIPFVVANAAPGDVYSFVIDPTSALLSLSSPNADPSTLGLPTGTLSNASISVAPIPEPASIGLLVLGGLLSLRRRRVA